MKTRDMVIGGMLTAILYFQQVLLAALPNMHLCTLLIIAYTICFPHLAIWIVAAFVLLEGLTYGFGIWWFSYLYIWPLLVLITWLLRKNTSILVWSILGGAFGLCYGALCAIPYLFAGGPAAAVSYWIAGIPFDLLHCVGNVISIAVLGRPVLRVLRRLGRAPESDFRLQK